MLGNKTGKASPSKTCLKTAPSVGKKGRHHGKNLPAVNLKRLHKVFDHARSDYTYGTSFKKSQHTKQYSFYLMKSRVSSNYTHDIHSPSMPEKKRSTEKKPLGERLQNGNGFKILCMQGGYWCNHLHDLRLFILSKCQII